MLVRSNLFSSIIFVIFFCSCAEEKKFFHVEISCPGKQTILARYITLKEVQASIARDIEIKKQGGTSEDYTVIYGSGGRSLKIPKVSPEDSLKCTLTEIPVINPDKNITKYN